MVVETDDAPGFRRGRKLEKLGLDAADTSELFFDDVSLPTENLLGRGRPGLHQLMKELAQERLMVAMHPGACGAGPRRRSITSSSGTPSAKRSAASRTRKFKLAECTTEARSADPSSTGASRHLNGKPRHGPPRWPSSGTPRCSVESSTPVCSSSAATATCSSIRSRALTWTPASAHLCRHERDHEVTNC